MGIAPPREEVLAGFVERVTFHNAENGFCVLRVKARGHRDLVTLVGHAAIVSAAEWITASGEWVNDRAKKRPGPHLCQGAPSPPTPAPPPSLNTLTALIGNGNIIAGVPDRERRVP